MGTDLRKIAASGTATALIIAAAFAVPFEGTEYKSYLDVGNVWTICNGHTGNVHEGQTATPKQCAQFLADDLAIAEAAYDRLVQRDYSPNVKAACMDFIYNAGTGAFAGSTLRKKLNKGNVKGACNEFPRWRLVTAPVGSVKDMRDGIRDGKARCDIKENGCGGIMTRRYAEKELCNDPNYYISFTFGPDNILRGVRGPSH